MKVPDTSLLIYEKGVKIMFGADTKALLAKYFQKDKSQFSQCSVQLIYTMFDNLFILVFVTYYPISWQLLIDIIFGYPQIGKFNTA